MKHLLTLSLLLSLSACAATRQYSADWPSAQGNQQRTGTVAEAARPPLMLSWTHSTEGRMVYAASVRNGTVYVGSRDGSLYALNLNDGSRRWSTEAGLGGLFGAPTVTDTLVYGGNWSPYYFVSAWNRENGELAWQRQSGELLNRPPFVLVDSERLYTHLDPPEGAPLEVQVHMSALSLDGQQILWRTPMNGIPEHVPSLTDKMLLVTSQDERLRAFDKADGHLHWEAELSGEPVSAPLVSGPLVFVSTATGFVYAFEHATGKIAWRYQFPNAQLEGDLALSGERLLVPGGRMLYSFNITTREAGWKFQAPREITAPVASREHVYFGGANKSLYTLRLDNGLITGIYPLGDEVLAPPVLAGGYVLVSCSDGKIYAFAEKPADPQASPGFQWRAPR